MYPGMAKTARDEGFAELAEWFETLGQGRAVACEPFSERAGQAEELTLIDRESKGGLNRSFSPPFVF